MFYFSNLSTFHQQVIDKYGLGLCRQVAISMQAGVVYTMEVMDLPAKSIFAMEEAFEAYIAEGGE